jgi:hypothetical protein
VNLGKSQKSLVTQSPQSQVGSFVGPSVLSKHALYGDLSTVALSTSDASGNTGRVVGIVHTLRSWEQNRRALRRAS